MLLDQVVACVEHVVGALAVWLLADQVGIDKDRQTHAARTHVADVSESLPGKACSIDRSSFVRVRRNEVRIEAMEALRAKLLGP